MTGDTHYDLEILAELAEGLLDAGTARQVREHLAVCDPCGELLADLAAVREVLAATPTPAMPMGVALRIDKALAAEAGSGRGGVGLAEPPNWDELMRDSPWDAAGNDPQPEPVRLGVVSDDGTIVPAGRKAARRRRWAMPAVAAAATAAVVGTAVISTNLFSGGATVVAGHQGATVDPPSPTKVAVPGKAYALTDSGHNYSDQELKQPLENFFGPAPIVGGGSSDVDAVDKCVNRVADRTKLKVFAVDQGQYNGQEAVIMTSWKNKSAKTLRIDIVDPFNCKNLRKPTVGSW